ncbi:MAG: helix-turn-helix transcriptional regulator [Ruminococcaceae bacterium]|nr:helix-turn-helix transcriptional regulator [Oscillospiraceae bacterium]
MSPGTLLLFGAGVPYRYLHDTECSMRLLGINFDFSTEKSNTPLVFPPERIEDFDFEKLGDTLFFSDAEIFNRPLIIKNASELYPKLSEIKKEYERKKLYCEQRCAALMLALLADIARFDEKDGEVGAEKVINSVIKYLRENYGDDISNSDLGKMFGYHPNYLNRIFIKYTGKSIYRYLQDLRIMQALRMLENTELPVSEIARLSGFRDLPHFSRYFKQKTGFSPKSFRI